jgi:hypothetical protein
MISDMLRGGPLSQRDMRRGGTIATFMPPAYESRGDGTVLKCTDRRRGTCQNQWSLVPATYMFLTIGFLVILAALTLVLRPRAAAKSEGWMSEQWLAEHRAAHPS